MTAPSFPFLDHRTVEQVVQDGDMHWPALRIAADAACTGNVVPIGSAKAAPSGRRLMSVPVHSQSSISGAQRDHG